MSRWWARVPRWLRWGTLAVVALLALLAWRYWSAPAAVRAAASALRETSVVVDDPNRGIVDVDRARQVIADRPIVVAVLPADTNAGSKHPEGDACRAIARRVDDVLVVVYLDSTAPYTCESSGFPAPDRSRDTASFTPREQWLLGLGIDVDTSSQFRLDRASEDRTPEVEELVLSFDHAVARDMANGVPRRHLSAS